MEAFFGSNEYRANSELLGKKQSSIKKSTYGFPGSNGKADGDQSACKLFFNTSDDSDLLIEAFNATGDQYEEGTGAEFSTKKIDSRAASLNAELLQGEASTDEPVRADGRKLLF